MDFRFDIIIEYMSLLLKGTLYTIGISLVVYIAVPELMYCSR